MQVEQSLKRSCTNYGIFLKTHLYSFLLFHLHCNPFIIVCRMLSIRVISIQITKPLCREWYEWNSNTRKPKQGQTCPCSCQEQLNSLAIPPVMSGLPLCKTDPWLRPRRREKLWVMSVKYEVWVFAYKVKRQKFQKDTPYFYNCLVFPDTFILSMLPWKPIPCKEQRLPLVNQAFPQTAHKGH